MAHVPVLAFHAIQPGRGPLRIDLETFDGIVRACLAAGATGVTASDAASIAAGGTTGPVRPIAFTFDDGYASVFENAFPILRAAGWPATMFPVTSGLGGRNTWDGDDATDLTIVDADQVRQLQHAGWEIGGHTHTHPSLPGLPAHVLHDELDRADEVLTEVLGTRPQSFAYPYGRHDPASRRVAERRYRTCWTIGAQRTRREDPADCLPRIEAWYVRRPLVARHLHDALGTAWLAMRRTGRSLDTIRRS